MTTKLNKSDAIELLEAACHLLNEIQLFAELDEEQQGKFWAIIDRLPEDIRSSVIN